MKLVDALATTLRDWELGYVFGVGGANIEHLFDAVHRLGHGRLHSVGAKSEIGAAFMADARARVHRTLGVCCATSGGGMMNLAVGIAESYAESVPVLAIVGQPPLRWAGRGAFQDSSGIGRSVDALRLWSAITKHQAVIDDPHRFWEDLESLVRQAVGGRPGPTVMMIPRDLFDCEVGPRPAGLPRSIGELRGERRAPGGELRRLLQAIRRARAPVLLVGSGVDRCGDPGAVVAFARREGVRVATTLSSKNSFPNGDPQYLGLVGVAGEPSAHRFLNESCDLLVAVGTGLNLLTRETIVAALAPGRLAVVNVDVGDLRRIVQPSLCIEADAGWVFRELDRLAAHDPAPARPHAATPLLRYAPQLAPALPAAEFGDTGGAGRGDLRQSDALAILQQHLPVSGHALFDAGNCAAAALHGLRLPESVSATVALGMGGMGYAVAGAVGAQLGSAQGARTVVICGDGAFLMLGVEVNTAVHHRLPILFVVFNNGMHGMCVTRQQLHFGGRIEASRYPPVSIAGLARSLGSSADLWVGSADTAAELRRRLDEYAARADRPGVLELRLAREEVPPFIPFLAADAPTIQVDLPLAAAALTPSTAPS